MRLFILPAVAVLLGLAAPAKAEITQCTNITTLPTVISTQGVYCLKQDLSTSITSGPAISITANNVTLDCNDWKVGGLAGGIETDASGVSSTKLNTTIRNCGIRGFNTGIELSGEGGYLVEDNRLDHNTQTGLYLRGDSNIVRRNRITDTGGMPLSSSSYGIYMYRATATLVADNLITNLTVTGNAAGRGSVYGVEMSSSKNNEIARNIIANILPAGDGSAYGTHGSSGWELSSIRDNTALNPEATKGTAFDGGNDYSICKGNTSRGFTNGMSWCVDAGGNFSN